MPWTHVKQLCSAHKKHGGACTQPAMPNGKCRMHGGKVRLGPSNPAWKHGRYSKVLPLRLSARYEDALLNPDLLSVRHDIAAAESQLADLFARLDTGESGAVWDALQKALAAFEEATAIGNRPVMHASLATLRRLITQGSSEYAAWDDIREMWQSRCKLTETEQRTLLVQQQMITVHELAGLLGVITHAIQERVTAHADAATARTILGLLSADLDALSTRQDGAGPRPVAQA